MDMQPRVTDADIEQFIDESGAKEQLRQLKEHISSKMPGGLIVSDVLDDNGNQYVDLVQEGGGVWGVALVGYTYILEEVGIRFFSLAGTSAGAINTMMLAVTGNANDKKCRTILRHLLELPLDQLVDGDATSPRYTRFVRWFIKKILIRQGFIKKVVNMLHWLIILFITLAAGSFIGNLLIHHYKSMLLGIAPLVLLIIIFILLAYCKGKFKDFLAKGIGMNAGKFFQNWVNDTIAGHTVGDTDGSRPIINLADFHEHFSKGIQLHIRPGRLGNNEAPKGEGRMISIITCDITSKNKIQFPRMWDLYWNDKTHVHPGDLVRASMSIPGFFKMFTVPVACDDTPEAKEQKLAIWQKHLQWSGDELPREVNFVDGGAISNFPINVFFNPNYPEPRMPTFGVRLNSDDGKDKIAKAATVPEYAASMLSSIRGYYDKDFVLRNPSFLSGIANVNLEDHNSVNFFMNNDEKKKLFLAGASEAVRFLKKFDWEKYKEERAKDSTRFSFIVDPNNLMGHQEKAIASGIAVEKIQNQTAKRAIKKDMGYENK